LSKQDKPAGEVSQVVRRSAFDYLVLAMKGFAVGSGNVVPGVSGGTMAFILGIFEELIGSIRKAADPEFLEAVVTFRWKRAAEIVDLKFLASIGAGALAAILTLARLLEWLLDTHPVFVWSFFFGLILASVVVVARRIRSWKGATVPAMILGTVGAWMLVGLVPLETPDTWWFMAIAGAVAICAMILPGVSGAFVLVLLGKYETILSAVNDGRIDVLAIVGVGAVIGLVSFAQILGWLFNRYHDLTVALLTGFMLGSLRKVWPWKEAASTYGDQAENAIPTLVSNVMPTLGVELAWAAVLGALGLALVLVMDRAQVTGSRAPESAT